MTSQGAQDGRVGRVDQVVGFGKLIGSQKKAKKHQALSNNFKDNAGPYLNNYTNPEHIGPEQIQCSTKKSKNSVLQDHAGSL